MLIILLDEGIMSDLNGTKIIFGEKEVDVGSRVVLWNDANGLSFYKYGVKYQKRDVSFEDLSKQINCFVLHHSVTYTAKQTYNALIGRNLSVNFIIDDDSVDGVATIYQCLDGKDAGQSHAPLNMSGPGVEISYMPLYKESTYSEHNRKKFGCQPHPVVDDVVHGQYLKVYGPSEAQVKAVINLLTGFCELFPGVNPGFPKGPDHKAARTVVRNASGLLAHSMITTNKIDPSGFPFEYVEKCVQENLTYGK